MCHMYPSNETTLFIFITSVINKNALEEHTYSKALTFFESSYWQD